MTRPQINTGDTVRLRIPAKDETVRVSYTGSAGFAYTREDGTANTILYNGEPDATFEVNSDATTTEKVLPPMRTDFPVGTIVQGVKYPHLIARKELSGSWRVLSGTGSTFITNINMAEYIDGRGEHGRYYRVIYEPE